MNYLEMVALLQLKRNKIDYCIARVAFHDFMILIQNKEEEGELRSEDTMIINERILDIEEEFKN